MSIPKAVQWLGDQIGDGLRAVGDVAGDALRAVGKGIQKLGDFARDTIRAIAKDPLPTLLSYAGTFIGIPPYVTSSVITAAKGGNLEDIAKSAAISYATTSFMSDTQIGADIKNYTTNQWAGDFTDSMMEKFDLSADQAVQISRVASSSLNSSLIGGINAALSGKSIATGISSGFTSGLVYSSTDSYFDSIKKNPNWGLSPVTLDLMKGATSTALNTIVSGKGDPAQAVGNYIAYASLNMAGSSLFNKAKETYQSLTKNTEATEKTQAKYAAEKTEYDKQLKVAEDLRKSVSADTASYQKTIDEQYNPFKKQYDGLIAANDAQAYAFNKNKQEFERNKFSAENWSSFYDIPQQSYIDAANAAADKANAAAAKSKEIQDAATKLYNDNKPMLDSLPDKAAKIEQKIADFSVIKDDIEIPKDGNLAERLQDASKEYQNKYDLWAAAKSEADKSAEDYTKALAEVATRDATIDAINSGAITATKQDEDGNWVLSNNMVLTKDGKFVQDGVQQFTNAAGINQKPLDLTSADGSKIDFSEDAGRLLSTSDVKNLAKRDYGLSITDEEAKKFAGKDYTEASIPELESFATTKAKEAGFPDYKAYQEFGGNLDAYKASVWKPTDTTIAGGEQTAAVNTGIVSDAGVSKPVQSTGTKTFANGTTYDYSTGLFKMPDGSYRDSEYNLYNEQGKFIGLEKEGRPFRVTVTGGDVDPDKNEIIPPSMPSDFVTDADLNSAGDVNAGVVSPVELQGNENTGGFGPASSDDAFNAALANANIKSNNTTTGGNQPISFDNTATILAINANGTALVQNDTTGAQSTVPTIGNPEVGSKVDVKVSASTGEATAVAKTEQPPLTPPVTPPAVTPPVVEPTEVEPPVVTPPVVTPPEVVPPEVIPPVVQPPIAPPEVVPPVTPLIKNPPVIPPVVTPPIEPPVVTPPVVTPPVVEPTVTPPPVVPPVVTPPVVEPPVVTPPVTPPVVAPPVTPPVVTPPVTPPVVAPPVAPAIGGVTIDAVTKAINDSIAGIQFPAGITPADVAEQIKSAMEANPNLKPEDVTKAITDYMSANPALTAADVNTAITGATKNLATQSQLDDAVKNLSADQKTQFNNLTQAQKDEVDARVKQGQDIQNAIASSQQTTSNQVQNIQGELNGRIDALVKQGVETNAAIQQAIAESQTQINRNDANINSRIDVLVGQGVDYQKATQIAFEETRGTINNVGKQLADKIKADEADKQAAAEAKRVADVVAEEEKKAAAAAALAKDIAAKQAAGRASTQAQQRAAGQGALSLLQPAATSELASVAGPLAAKYLMAKEDPNKFESPLEKFLKTQNQSFGKENQYGIQPQGNVMNDPSYSYGTQRPIEDILGMGSAQSTQAGQASDSSIPSYPTALPYAQGGMAGTRHGKYAQGGLSTPLMASGGKMRVDFRHGDAVTGAGDGQSDDIPAMLADGEFVFPADVVAAIGNGSTKAGSDKLYDMMHGIRAHARSAKPKDLPPQIKSPLDFLKRS